MNARRRFDTELDIRASGLFRHSEFSIRHSSAHSRAHPVPNVEVLRGFLHLPPAVGIEAKAADPALVVTENGMLRALADGATTLTVSVQGESVTVPVEVRGTASMNS